MYGRQPGALPRSSQISLYTFCSPLQLRMLSIPVATVCCSVQHCFRVTGTTLLIGTKNRKWLAVYILATDGLAGDTRKPISFVSVRGNSGFSPEFLWGFSLKSSLCQTFAPLQGFSKSLSCYLTYIFYDKFLTDKSSCQAALGMLLCLFSGAAVAKYHTLWSLNSSNPFCHSCGDY